MKKIGVVLALLASAAGVALAQSDEVTQSARAHASMMILLMVVGGLVLIFLLMSVLRAKGKLPVEIPLPKPRWVHPEDNDNQ